MNHAANDPPMLFAGTVALVLMRVARMAGWAAIAAITILSLVPGSERPHTGLPGPAEHFAAYACTGLALSLAYLGLRERLIFWFGLATASSVFEILQRRIPDRDAEMQDALVSSFGLTTGLVLGAMAAVRLFEEKQRLEHGRRRTPAGPANRACAGKPEPHPAQDE
jgi:hypothetical protein